LGPPGSGKGTHAQNVCRDFGIPHVSTGDMLRKEVAAATDLGSRAKRIMDAGDLVPDDLVMTMVVQRLSQADVSRGWILDGFPRTLPQAQALDAALQPRGIDVVVALKVPRDEVIDRVVGRRSCPRGHIYHVTSNPPGRAGVCDVDGEPLFQRPDDTEQVVLDRLSVYERETAPLIDHYRRQGDLAEIDGTGAPGEVYERVRWALRADPG
jgi:adenylate kinase